MKILAGRVFSALIFLVAGAAFAQENGGSLPSCPSGQQVVYSTPYYSGSDADAAVESFPYGAHPRRTYFNPGTGVLAAQSQCSGYMRWSTFDTIAYSCEPVPPPPDCGSVNDEYGAPDSTPASVVDGDVSCQGGCEFVYHNTEGLQISLNPSQTGIVGGAWFSATGASCTVQGQSIPVGQKLPNPARQNEVCKQVPIYSIPDANGNRVVTANIPICASTDPAKDGQETVDGTPHDYSQSPSQVCATKEDGSQVCDTYPKPPGTDQHQDTPPAPNKGAGDATHAADPLGCIQAVYSQPGSSSTTTTTTCEYTSSTVSNSTTSAGGGGRGTTSGGTVGGTTGSTGGTSGGTTGGTTGGTCDPSTTTCGDGSFSAPALGDAKTFQQSGQDFFNGVSAAPIVQGFAGIHLNSSDTCPTYSKAIPYLNKTLTVSSHCDIIASVGPTLKIISLVAWFMIAIRVFLSA